MSAVFLFGLIWGRNRAPFPMPKSIFYSQLLINNSQFINCENSSDENHSFLGVSEAKLPKYERLFNFVMSWDMIEYI